MTKAKLELKTHKPEWVQSYFKAQELFAQGLSVRAISFTLNKKYGTVYGWLKIGKAPVDAHQRLGRKKKGQPWNKGKSSPETKILLGRGLRKAWRDAEFRKRICPKLSVAQSKNAANKSRQMKELWANNEEFQTKMQKALPKLWQKLKGHPNWVTLEARKRQSESLRKAYERPEVQANYRKCRQRKPNKFESEFIESFPELKYVGDYSFWVGRKNPDFVVPNTNICIDLFGNHWHDVQEAEDRIVYFSDRGYKLFIIWEKDWRTNSSPIVQFISSLLKQTLSVQIIQT
jgi:very-short-patch-repair endonuclease